MSLDSSALDALREQDIFGCLVFRWDASLNLFVDQGGIPLSKTAAKALRPLIREHLSKTPSELSECANRVLSDQMPARKVGDGFSPERFA